MEIAVQPGRPLAGRIDVPGDKSIAHRWLILAATAEGPSRIADLPPSLDVVSTASCLSSIAPGARRPLEDWTSKVAAATERHGFTWHPEPAVSVDAELEVEGEGRGGLGPAVGELDCGNSGTTMRLLAGVLATTGFRTVLSGDASLRSRPMERIAEPLRRMGAVVRTEDGHPPIAVEGRPLRGIAYRVPVPSAQVKSAVLLAGLAAEGRTVIDEPAATRDHTERALRALGAPVEIATGRVSVSAFAHGGFAARVPGDVSSAAFLVAAVAIAGGEVTIEGVGLNPSRLRFLDVMRRMGVRVEARPSGEELGEPVGEVRVEGGVGLVGATVGPDELPLVIDEVPVLAALAAHAVGDTRFVGAGELRVKESDRLSGVARMLRGLGAHAAVGGDDLVIAGGGATGGRADAGGDHRMAMAAVVAALGANDVSRLEGVEAASVSFPGFVPTLRSLGAAIEG